MKKTFILLISILLSACGNESHVSEKEPLTERANIEQFTSNIEKCKAQKYKHIRVASDISECALKSIDTYKYSVIKELHFTDFREIPSEVQSYLVELTLGALKEKDYKTTGQLMAYIEVGAFTHQDSKYMSESVQAFTPENKDIYIDVLKHMFNSGMAYEVYSRLYYMAILDLAKPGYAGNTGHLRAVLIHYGCIKTASIWGEITSDSGSVIPRGSQYPEILLSKADRDYVIKQRLLLRRDGVIPTLQKDCPIFLTKEVSNNAKN